MKIASLSPIYPSPSQTFVRREIASLEAHGMTVQRFTLRRFAQGLRDEADQQEEQRTCAILEAGVLGLARALVHDALTRPIAWGSALAAAVRMGVHSERGLIHHLIYFAEACVLRHHLAKSGVEHVHAQFASNSAAIALLCRLIGGPPYSITIHGPEDLDQPLSESLREKVHHAAFVAAISEFTRGQLYRWCSREDWQKIHVVHCGLDEDLLCTASVPIRDRPRLVNVGRLAEQKGQILLVDAAAQLRERGFDFELVIVGDGPIRSELEQRIGQHGLEGHVRITGYLSNGEVLEELRAARRLVLPSLAEGLPVVIMESFAMGRPVISTYIAGIPELIEAGVNGWLVPAGAIDPLVAAMAEVLLADPQELERMGRAGAARVAEQHRSLTEAKKLACLIEKPDSIVGGCAETLCKVG